MDYWVGQQVAPGLVVVHEDTLKLLREQADAKNDLRKALHDADLQVRELKEIADELHGRACDCGCAGKCKSGLLLDKADGVGTERRVEEPSRVAHCYVGGYCHYFHSERRCICLCEKCKGAKAADH